MVQITDILQTVRELTFDRFIIPGVAIKAIPGKTITINASFFWIKNTDGTDFYKGDLSVLTTYKALTDDLLSKAIVFSYTVYFNGSELCTTFIPVTDAPLTVDFIANKRYFFSDATVKQELIYYYYKILCINATASPTTTNPAPIDFPVVADDTIINAWLALLKYPSEKHMALWISYNLVDKRRLYEVAAEYVGLNYSDGTVYSTGSKGGTENATETTVQIGSVFSITEDPNNGDLYEDFNKLGSDNVLGDKHTFWYRLMLYLREKLENEFGDYSLRKDTVISSDSTYHNAINFRAYYDSYPFTLSPLSRNIVTLN